MALKISMCRKRALTIDVRPKAGGAGPGGGFKRYFEGK